jgi:hypothetical protein
MFHRASLVDEFKHMDVMTVLDKFVNETRDVNLVWPKRKFISARVRRVTEFFAKELPRRI